MRYRLRKRSKKILSAIAAVNTACACTLYKAFAVGTFRNCWILFMCANVNAVQNAIVFRYHIVLALSYCTLNARVLLIFHNKLLPFIDAAIFSYRLDDIIYTASRFYAYIFLSISFQPHITIFTHNKGILKPCS